MVSPGCVISFSKWMRLDCHVSKPLPTKLFKTLLHVGVGSNHPLEGHCPIPPFEKAPHQAPIEPSIRPDADPLALAVRRSKKPLAPKQEGDVRFTQPERDRRLPFDPLECHERPLACPEVWVAPRAHLASLGQRKAE